MSLYTSPIHKCPRCGVLTPYELCRFCKRTEDESRPVVRALPSKEDTQTEWEVVRLTQRLLDAESAAEVATRDDIARQVRAIRLSLG